MANPSPQNNEDLFSLASSFIHSIQETLNRIKSLPRPTPERLRQVADFLRHLEHFRVALDQHVNSIAHNEITHLRSLRAEENEQRKRLADTIDTIRQLTRAAEAAPTNEFVAGHLEPAKNTAQEIKTKILPNLEAQIIAQEGLTEEAQRRELKSPAHAESLQFLSELGDLLSKVSEFERTQQEWNDIESKADIDFDQRAQDFAGACQYHRERAGAMLWTMVAIVAAGIASIAWMFGDLHFECTGRFSGSVDLIIILERLVLAGVGRIAVLTLIAWALVYVGSLHRSHSEQAIIYSDRRAALGVVTNLMRAASDIAQKQQLLQSIARSYLGFEQNAFRAARDSNPRSFKKKAASEIKELADVARPLVDLVQRTTKKG